VSDTAELEEEGVVDVVLIVTASASCSTTFSLLLWSREGGRVCTICACMVLLLFWKAMQSGCEGR